MLCSVILVTSTTKGAPALFLTKTYNLYSCASHCEVELLSSDCTCKHPAQNVLFPRLWRRWPCAGQTCQGKPSGWVEAPIISLSCPAFCIFNPKQIPANPGQGAFQASKVSPGQDPLLPQVCLCRRSTGKGCKNRESSRKIWKQSMWQNLGGVKNVPFSSNLLLSLRPVFCKIFKQALPRVSHHQKHLVSLNLKFCFSSLGWTFYFTLWWIQFHL